VESSKLHATVTLWNPTRTSQFSDSYAELSSSVTRAGRAPFGAYATTHQRLSRHCDRRSSNQDDDKDGRAHSTDSRALSGEKRIRLAERLGHAVVRALRRLERFGRRIQLVQDDPRRVAWSSSVAEAILANLRRVS
jgi:hypothetical protein